MKGLGGKILGLFVSIAMIAGGLSGRFVLRGTDNSTALVILGIILLMVNIISLITHKKEIPDPQIADGDAPVPGENADSATTCRPEPRDALPVGAVAMPVGAFPFRLFLLQMVSLFVFIAAIVFLDYDMHMPHRLQSYLGILILGIGFYLIYRGGSGQIAGILGLVLLGVAAMVGQSLEVWRDGEFSPQLPPFSFLIQFFLFPGVVVILGMVGARQKKKGAYFGMCVFLTALAMLFLEFSQLWKNGFFDYVDENTLIMATLAILFNFAVIPAAYLARAYQERGGRRLSVSVIARLWCAFVFLATTAALVYNITERQPAVLQSLLLLPATLGMFLLIFGVSGGFHLVLFGVGFAIIHTLTMLVTGNGARGPLVVSLIAPGINLLITWLLIRRAPPRATEGVMHAPVGANQPVGVPALQGNASATAQRTGNAGFASAQVRDSNGQGGNNADNAVPQDASKGMVAGFQPYTGKGVCDVCNKPLGDMRAYMVPNHIFYSSPKWREHYKKMMGGLFGKPVADAQFEVMRMRDNSAGSAVCDGCIHMFNPRK